LIHNGKYSQAIEILYSIYNQPGPFQPSAGNDLAWVLATHDPARLNEAKLIAMSVYKQGHPSAQLLDTLGWIEHLRGDNEQALKYLNQAVVQQRSIPDLYRHLEVVYRKLGNDRWADYYSAAK